LDGVDPDWPSGSVDSSIHAEVGYIIMPHTLPAVENIVVVKGSWALGMGARFSRETLKPMEVGDYGFTGRKMPHFGVSTLAHRGSARVDS